MYDLHVCIQNPCECMMCTYVWVYMYDLYDLYDLYVCVNDLY
jgi:hypothetical protein